MPQTAKNWVKNGNGNVCMVDWKGIAGGWIYPVVTNFHIQKVVGVVTTFLQFLKICHRINIEDVSIAGHSLGAQVGMFYEKSFGKKVLIVVSHPNIYLTQKLQLF